jgi:transcriptional regulator GlxA family with amidase domain
MSNPPNFNIVIPIYDGVDLMDVAAPHEIFSWINAYWTEKTIVITLAAKEDKTILTRDKLKLTPDTTFEVCYKEKYQADLIWVPGGDVKPLKCMMEDTDYQGFLKQQSANATWVTSVCEGAMLLASAGLLDGYLATTHWAFITCLKSFKSINVAEGYPRYVVDRNRVTGGGISSGLDESLKIVSLIAGDDVAQQIQLVTQYFPCPPFSGKIPDSDTCPLDSVECS